MTSLRSRVCVPAAVQFREVEGESVLLHLETGHYFGLDDVGTRMWQLLVRHGSVGDVIEELQAEYDVEPARLETDLLRLIDELAGHRLLQVEGD